VKFVSVLSLEVSRPIKLRYKIPNLIEPKGGCACSRNDPTSSYLCASSCFAIAVLEGREGKRGVSAGEGRSSGGVSHPNSYADWLKWSSLNTTQEANLKKF